jgi:hypothetical protein
MGRFLRTQTEAKDYAKAAGTQFVPASDTIEFPSDQPSIIAFLNDLVEGLVGEGAPAATRESYAARTLRVDDQFTALPLTQQLTLAALACEAAHKHLNGSRPARVLLAAAAPPAAPGAEDLV